MTDTTVTDAVCFPQDAGTGVPDESADYDSAAFFSLLSKYKGDGSYVGEDATGSPTLQFAAVDTTNETVDVDAGYAYIVEGGHSVQSGSQTTYDTTLPIGSPYVVVLPTNVTGLGLGADTDSDLWLAVDPTANDSVYIRHGSGLSVPTDPSVKLGTVDSSTGATTRANDLAPASFSGVDVDGDTALTAVAATGQVTLSSGSAVVDTAISVTDATFYLALGIDDPAADAKVAGRLFWDDSAGTYKMEIVEDGTSVGNPTVNYDVLRVR